MEEKSAISEITDIVIEMGNVISGKNETKDEILERIHKEWRKEDPEFYEFLDKLKLMTSVEEDFNE